MVLSAALSGNAFAAATLTSAALAQGFTLSTFVDQIPNSGGGGVGPTGIANISGNQVMISDYFTGQVRVFNDTDNQTWSGSVASGQAFGAANAHGLATVGSHIYLAQEGAQKVIEIDSSGNYVQDIVSGLGAVAVVANPTNGHLYVSTFSGNIWDVDPAAKTKTVFNSQPADGLMISPDGATLYAATSDRGYIYGFDTTSKTQVFNSGFVVGGVDGTALGFGGLAGNLFINTNAGTLVELNMTSLLSTTLMTGGSRGDFVSVDSSNGSLLITQTDSVLRLTAPSGSGFGASTVPEPNILALFGIAAASFAAVRKRRNISA